MSPLMADFQKDLRQQEALHKLKEKKKKSEEELKSLEEQKKKEIAQAEKEITTRTAQLEREQRDKAREEEERKIRELQERQARLEKELEAMHASLEDIVGKENIQGQPPAQITYMIEALKDEQAPLYAITDYNVYNNLADIRNKAAAGEYLTRQEQEFIEETRRTAERFHANQDYLSVKDPNNYVILIFISGEKIDLRRHAFS
jgi:predicted RNase H-like nuclease (RuvC/YqgF family)